MYFKLENDSQTRKIVEGACELLPNTLIHYQTKILKRKIKKKVLIIIYYFNKISKKEKVELYKEIDILLSVTIFFF